MQDSRHSVKMSKTFIKKVKHTCTDEYFPFDNISKFFTLSTWMQIKVWNNIKDDKGRRASFIQRLRKAEIECKENDYLKNPKQEIDDKNE